ncbi:bifunctional metallophosphatase/5'-nucleotidase [Thaumasiovibrio sp. DFM-14]|uniref:bifunctional metallophosphatase/5'-nucleotidase n=1 Tax=Thaumasiovibrio sp. DFM-14 TaxID=3384792 RepID=UPI0039A1B5D1
MSQDNLLLRLAHINDSHSHFETSTVAVNTPQGAASIQCGGLGLVSSFLQAQRQQAQRDDIAHLFVDCGDAFQGSLYFSLYRGKVNACVQNHLQPDAMLLGNHEFDLGNETVYPYLQQLTCPVVVSNWDTSRVKLDKCENLTSYNPKTRCGDYLIKQFGSHQIAIMGLTLDNMNELAHPDPNTPFLHVESTLTAMIEDAHAKGIFNIILLSHLGYAKDQRLAKNIAGISVIVGGHTHTWQGDFSSLGLVNDEPYGKRVGETLIFQAGCHALCVGSADLQFNAAGYAQLMQGKSRLLVEQSQPLSCELRHYLSSLSCVEMVSVDPEITHLLAPYRGQVEEMASHNVASAEQMLRHIRVPAGEEFSHIAPLVCDAFVWQAEESGLPVDCAIHNAGGVRVHVDSGTLTAAEIAGRLLPFAIDLVRYRITGKVLKETIDSAISNAVRQDGKGSGDGSFPYTSHLRYCYDRSLPSGERLQALLLYRYSEWQPIVDDESYWVVSSRYTAMGKGGYETLAGLGLSYEPLGYTMAEAFIHYAAACETLTPPTENLTVILE